MTWQNAIQYSSMGYKMLYESKKLKVGFEKGIYKSFYSQLKPNSDLSTFSAFVAESVIGLSLGRNLSNILPRDTKCFLKVKS